MYGEAMDYAKKSPQILRRRCAPLRMTLRIETGRFYASPKPRTRKCKRLWSGWHL